jgi:hypothetical protein
MLLSAIRRRQPQSPGRGAPRAGLSAAVPSPRSPTETGPRHGQPLALGGGAHRSGRLSPLQARRQMDYLQHGARVSSSASTISEGGMGVTVSTTLPLSTSHESTPCQPSGGATLNVPVCPCPGVAQTPQTSGNPALNQHPVAAPSLSGLSGPQCSCDSLKPACSLNDGARAGYAHFKCDCA